MKFTRVQHPRHDGYSALNNKKRDSQHVSQIKQRGLQVKVLGIGNEHKIKTDQNGKHRRDDHNHIEEQNLLGKIVVLVTPFVQAIIYSFCGVSGYA
jgi:hypothetical protein